MSIEVEIKLKINEKKSIEEKLQNLVSKKVHLLGSQILTIWRRIMIL